MKTKVLEQSSSSVIGGTLLVAGCCIGAGMLALPILAGLCGFFPALIFLFAAWAFMTFTALLLVEAQGSCEKGANLLTMVQGSLGPWGRKICWMTYLFLFYAILVAYTTVGGSLVASFFEGLQRPISQESGSLIFAFFFGSIIYLGTRPVDLLNRLLMAGLIATYLGMVGLGLFRVESANLLHSSPSYFLLTLPMLVISFGFHNFIPSLAQYMNGDLQKVRFSILAGSLTALAVYLIWLFFVIGVVPYGEIHSAWTNGIDATGPLCQALGKNVIAAFSQGFAFFAIATSYLAQGVSLIHFIADGIKMPKHAEKSWQMTLVALIPPMLFAIGYPNVFFKALGFAGGICAMILFGILPILMAEKNRRSPTQGYRVRGGRLALGIAFLFAILVISSEAIRLLSVSA